MITAEQFLAATGREPVQDDLERVNCIEAGYVGHFACGWCRHNKPVFDCGVCLIERNRPSHLRRIMKD